MSLYNFAWTGMYSRDWELACEFWIATRIKTRFIVHSDDDAILCAQTLTRSLGLLPVPTHGLVLGWDLWDGFDNCFILVSRDVADYFALHWYDTLRPRSRRGGATLGEGWLEAGDSRGRGSWKSQLLAAGVPLLFRRARVIDAPGEPLVVDPADTFGGERAASSPREPSPSRRHSIDGVVDRAGEIHLAAHAARRHAWPIVLATLYGDASLRDADGALLAAQIKKGGNMDPLVFEKTVARVWDKDRATRLAEFRRDPYISPVLERRHDKVISEAVLDAVYPADAAAFCRHRFHIDKFKLPELMRWWRGEAS